MNSAWQPPHSLITPTCHLGVFGSAIVCVPWQSVQPGACSTLVARSLPCWLPAQTFFTLPWQVPQVSGTFARETALFITPGFRFRIVDQLLTNFHLPKSTLLMLVSAFAGLDRVRTAYMHAIEQRYRFFSYGDSMLLERAT